LVLRDILPTLHFVCLPGAARAMASILAASMQTATWPSAGVGEAVFSSRLARTRATNHEAAHAETEAVAEDGRCCMCARALWDHGAPRRSPQKPRVVDRGHISTGQCSRCAGRAIRGPALRWSASLNRHKIWPDCENGLKKEGWAGLDIRNANNGAPPRPLPNPVLRAAGTAYEPRTRAVSAGPRPAAAGTEEGQIGASPGAGRGHRPPNPAPSGPGAKLDPGPPGPAHPAPNPVPHCPLDPGGERRTAERWPISNIAAPGPSDRAASHWPSLVSLALCPALSQAQLLTSNPGLGLGTGTGTASGSRSSSGPRDPGPRTQVYPRP
jgi:hypothetical protein